jgi:hypothetical protein
VEQDCPDGEKCVIWFNDPVNGSSEVCRPQIGMGQPGDPCTLHPDGSDTCDVGVSCEAMSPSGGDGVCVTGCDTDAD